MSLLIKSIGFLGNALLKNRGKIVLGLGAMALAPAMRWAMNRYLGLKSEIEEASEKPEAAHSPKPRRNKRDVYQAPQVPPQNLIRH